MSEGPGYEVGPRVGIWGHLEVVGAGGLETEVVGAGGLETWKWT